MENRVWNIRTWIYAFGLAAVVIASICKCSSAHAFEDADNNVFWPADMIPHPTCPGDGPGENKDPEMS